MEKNLKSCPCCSGKTYDLCCRVFHQGTLPSNALELMRSRYSAYALDLPDYIVDTTHPGSPQYVEDRADWKRKISAFSRNSKFTKLEVLDFKEKGTVATVTFIAHITQKKQDLTFTEKSFFEKLRGKWFYRSGQLMEGHAPNLVTTSEMRILPLAYYGNTILRRVADPVMEITDSVRKLVEEMIETMDACDGVGLAAPQVHHSVRIFVLREAIEDGKGHFSLGEPKVYINAVVSEPSAETWKVSEGCLSIPTIQAEVERPKEITIEYMDLEGRKVRERCSGWMARIIMHEADHINGVLFIDHLSEKEKKELDPFLKRMDKRIHDGTEL